MFEYAGQIGSATKITGSVFALTDFIVDGLGIYRQGAFNDFVQVAGIDVLNTVNYNTEIELCSMKNGDSIRVYKSLEWADGKTDLNFILRGSDGNNISVSGTYLPVNVGGSPNSCFIASQIDDENESMNFIVCWRHSDYELYIAKLFTNISNEQLYTMFREDVNIYSSDPWAGAGFAGIGGGNGTFDFSSDTIALPNISNINAISTGFLQLFTGSLSEIKALSTYLWSSNFSDTITKAFLNPMDIILGLYMYPFVVAGTNRKYVRAGNVITDIILRVPDNQIYEIDCGEIAVPAFYGAYLDYEPFTKCEIYLPYCGTFNLSSDDLIGKTLKVIYRIDLLTGVCGAYLLIDGSVKYNFTGVCAINIPISARSFENVYNSIMNVVSSAGSGGFSYPSIGAIAGAVSSGKHQISHGGNATGNVSFMGVQKPYLIFNIPRVAIPKDLNTYTGYPYYATEELGNLRGYTEVEEIHLENMGTATAQETEKIVSLLKGGVIL